MKGLTPSHHHRTETRDKAYSKNWIMGNEWTSSENNQGTNDLSKPRKDKINECSLTILFDELNTFVANNTCFNLLVVMSFTNGSE